MLSDAPAWVFLFISIAVAALPAALLLILRALFSWRYRITVDHYMGQRSAGPPASAEDTCSLNELELARKGLSLSPVKGKSPLIAPADKKLEEARQVGRRTRSILAIAGSIQIIFTAVLFYWYLKYSSLSIIYPPLLTAYLTMVPGVVLLAAFALRTTGSRAALLAVYLAVGSVVILSDTDNILANDADLLRIGLKNSIVPLLGVGLLLVRRLRQVLLMGAALGIIWYILMMLFGMLFGREATKGHHEVIASQVIISFTILDSSVGGSYCTVNFT
jgi:hypothetical protein